MTRVLVAEDVPDIREMVGLKLSLAGYAVSTVADGEETLAYCRTHLPDLLLLDVALPGISGLEVCRTLRAQDDAGSLRIMMVSGLSTDADLAAGLRAGADDYLVKPFSPNSMLGRVRGLLDREQRLHSAMRAAQAARFAGGMTLDLSLALRARRAGTDSVA